MFLRGFPYLLGKKILLVVTSGSQKRHIEDILCGNRKSGNSQG